MKRGVQAVKARQDPTKTTFFCLSNSNSVFINTILAVRSLWSSRRARTPLAELTRALG
jgi:hypothetical protein